MYEIRSDEQSDELYVKVEGKPFEEDVSEALEEGAGEIERLDADEKERLATESDSVAPEEAAVLGGRGIDAHSGWHSFAD